jgi:hypothetical protein
VPVEIAISTYAYSRTVIENSISTGSFLKKLPVQFSLAGFFYLAASGSFPAFF